MLFSTYDQEFLEQHSITSSTRIKIFVRVKERIKPQQCYYQIKSLSIEIVLIKDNEFDVKWHQLQPNEYSESRILLQSSPQISVTHTNLINKGSYRVYQKLYKKIFIE